MRTPGRSRTLIAIADTAVGRRQALSQVASVSMGDALRTCRDEWNVLGTRPGQESPFTSWAWYNAWWETCSQAERDRSVAVVSRSADGRLSAVLPVSQRSIRFRRRCVRALTWATGDDGCPDHLDVLASSEADARGLAPAIVDIDWDILRFDNVSEQAPMADALMHELRDRGFVVVKRPLWRCPYIDLPTSWDEYLGSLSRSRREAIRRKERALHKRGHVALTSYSGAQVGAGMQLLIDLHDARWHGTGAFNARAAELHRHLSRELSRSGELWLFTLDVDDRPVAAWYGFVRGGTLAFYQSGRDPAWASLGVGAVLMGIMIRRAIEGGIRRFDFLRGEESYKAAWASKVAMTYELLAFRSSWRARIVRGLDLIAGIRDRMVRSNKPARVDS